MAARRSSRLSSVPATAIKASTPRATTTKPAQTAGRKRKAKIDAEDDSAPEPKVQAKPKSKAKTSSPSLEKKIAVKTLPNSTAAVPDKTEPLLVPTTPRKPRLANPLATNAQLISPETSRIIASVSLNDLSPSKAAVTTSTTNLLEEACAHLIKIDARLKPLIEKNHCRVFSSEGLAEKVDPFESLASGIISQQVSGAAAKSIKAKFIALFNSNSKFPTPSEVAPVKLEVLRTAGLSQRKAEYVQGLAEKFSNGELSAEMLFNADYDEIIEKLTAVRGLGRWSVEMFACFGLKRMDVFSTGDLGVQRGMAAFIGRDVSKLRNKGGKWKYMSEQDMIEMSDKFSPYRSLFMWYMWRVEETDISTLE